MRKIFNSKLATIAAAGIIVALGGGTGAYAATAIGGDTIVDNTLDGGEVQNGTLTGNDIKDHTLGNADLDASVKDSILGELKAGGQLDTKGAMVYDQGHLTGTGFDAVPSGPTVLVTLTVTGTSTDAPSRVTFTVGGTPITCVAAPAGAFEGTCSAVATTTGGNVDVQVEGPAVEAHLTGVSVG